MDHGGRKYDEGGIMLSVRATALFGIVGAVLAGPFAGAQRPGGMGAGMKGMMGMTHDSATMALAAASHQLVMDHDRITRTVVNLPNGIRTVTESDDPRVAASIKDHVTTTVQRVEKGADPGLPMESPALRAIFRLNDKVRTTTETTAKGVVVIQTSDDSATVVALQTHAAEVSDLVKGGMAAMHAAMMKNGMMGMRRPDTAAAMPHAPPKPPAR
jgi:hypothetical protein